MNEQKEKTLGYIATSLSVMMYLAYIPQINSNLHGNKGVFIQPLVASINCTLWVIYGLFKKNRDLPLALANALGIVLGLITVYTALF